MHFRKKSSSSGNSDGSGGHGGQQLNVKVSREDADRLKIRTGSIADPILEAVHEAQPFEQAAETFQDNMNRKSYFSVDGTGVLRDVFGQPINQPDVSNPTRARDERPLDTIRSFEYAVSGDPSWAQQLETPQYGFRVRPDFPLFASNPYDGAQGMVPQQQSYAEQTVYQAPVDQGNQQKKKKKRGLFGRKKNKDKD